MTRTCRFVIDATVPTAVMTRGWSRVDLAVPIVQADDVAARCIELGSCGVHTEEAGDTARLHVYFEGGDPGARRRRLMAQLRSGDPPLSVTAVGSALEPLRDWGAAWRRYYRPVWATEAIVVHPPWIPVAARSDQVAIQIDPAMAFGTGGHESTQLALRAIEATGVDGATCLDLGTGSGILAIALVRLGAARVTAVDIDPVALDNARHNLLANLGDQAARVHVRAGTVHVVATQRFDLVVANLEFHLVRSQLAAIAGLIDPTGGCALFSGLLESDESAFVEAVEAVGMGVHSKWRQNGWLSCSARRAG